VLTASSFGGVKQSGAWKGLDSTYVKVGGTWRRIQAGWAKVNGDWRLFKGFGAPVITPSFTSSYFGGPTPPIVPAVSVAPPPYTGGYGDWTNVGAGGGFGGDVGGGTSGDGGGDGGGGGD
jgi:hypothetical protein